MKKLLNKIQTTADQDLNIILILTLIPLFFSLTFKQTLFSYINQTSVSLWTRLILLAGLQFAIAVFETPFNLLQKSHHFLYKKRRAYALLNILLNYLAIFAKYSRVRTSCEVYDISLSYHDTVLTN